MLIPISGRSENCHEEFEDMRFMEGYPAHLNLIWFDEIRTVGKETKSEKRSNRCTFYSRSMNLDSSMV